MAVFSAVVDTPGELNGRGHLNVVILFSFLYRVQSSRVKERVRSCLPLGQGSYLSYDSRREPDPGGHSWW